MKSENIIKIVNANRGKSNCHVWEGVWRLRWMRSFGRIWVEFGEKLNFTAIFTPALTKGSHFHGIHSQNAGAVSWKLFIFTSFAVKKVHFHFIFTTTNLTSFCVNDWPGAQWYDVNLLEVVFGTIWNSPCKDKWPGECQKEHDPGPDQLQCPQTAVSLSFGYWQGKGGHKTYQDQTFVVVFRMFFLEKAGKHTKLRSGNQGPGWGFAAEGLP